MAKISAICVWGITAPFYTEIQFRNFDMEFTSARYYFNFLKTPK